MDSEGGFAESIKSLAGNIPDPVNEDPREIVRAILLLIDNIYVDGEHEREFDEWCDSAGAAWCKLSGQHQWIHDHCGFWGHATPGSIQKFPDVAVSAAT